MSLEWMTMKIIKVKIAAHQTILQIQKVLIISLLEESARVSGRATGYMKPSNLVWLMLNCNMLGKIPLETYKIDDRGRVLYFSEKPKGVDLKAMKVDTIVLGLSPNEADKKPYIASMGVYVFNKDILLKFLRFYPTANDFGSKIIPTSTKECNVQAYLFNDYWEDIGTIKSFFGANLALGA